VDNHDVNRLASTLKDERNLKNCYTLMYGMPGIPSIYYGSEFGVKGIHENNSDDGLRPCLDLDELLSNGNLDLYNHIVRLGRIYSVYPALRTGSYQTVIVRNRQLLFKKELNGQVVYVALNLDETDYGFNFHVNEDSLVDLITNTTVEINGNHDAYVNVKPFSSMVIVTDDILNEEPAPQEKESVEREVQIGSKYKDASGNVYKVVTIARDYASQEELIIYKALFGSSETWAMPKTLFLGNVDNKQRFVEV
jgi:hypothetical protein